MRGRGGGLRKLNPPYRIPKKLINNSVDFNDRAMHDAR